MQSRRGFFFKIYNLAALLGLYRLLVKLNSGVMTVMRNYVVDCVVCFLKIIIYEGQDKNPEMCRVLLTHEIMCRSVNSWFISSTVKHTF